MPRKKAPHFMRWVVADYRRDTASLGTIHHGAYLLLLMELWERGGTLPATVSELSTITGCRGRQFAAVWDRIARFFTAADGRNVLEHRPSMAIFLQGMALREWLASCETISQDRITADLAQVAEIAQKRAAAGRRGGRPKGGGEGKQLLSETKANAYIETKDLRSNPIQQQVQCSPPPARAREADAFVDPAAAAPSDVPEDAFNGHAMDSPGAWRELLVNHYGWPLHGTQTAKAAKLFADGARSDITPPEAIRAINAAHAARGGERPGSVAYYRPFLREVLEQRRDRGGLETNEASRRRSSAAGGRVSLTERSARALEAADPDEEWGAFFGSDDGRTH